MYYYSYQISMNRLLCAYTYINQPKNRITILFWNPSRMLMNFYESGNLLTYSQQLDKGFAGLTRVPSLFSKHVM